MSETTLLGLGLMVLIGFLAAIGFEVKLIELLIAGVVALIGIFAQDARKKKDDNKNG